MAPGDEGPSLIRLQYSWANQRQERRKCQKELHSGNEMGAERDLVRMGWIRLAVLSTNISQSSSPLLNNNTSNGAVVLFLC